MKINKTKFSIGSDPELFLKKEIDGIMEYFPAVTVVPGNKYKPTPIDDEGRNILVDNVMLEFNTLPTLDVNSFIKEHLTFLIFLKKEMLKKKCVISKESFVTFHPRFLKSESAETFGCEPDYNAYTLDENISPEATVDYRTAAGHIHIGYDNKDYKKSIELIKLLDLTLGVNSVLVDSDRHRRMMYGKAGAHRMKDFGFEYRVLSNYWIFDKIKLLEVYKGVERAFELYNIGYSMDKSLEKKVIKTINNYDTKMAMEIMNKLNKIKK